MPLWFQLLRVFPRNSMAINNYVFFSLSQETLTLEEEVGLEVVTQKMS